jgi:hypothetical protein
MGKVIKTHIDLRTFQGKIKKIGLESIPTLPNEKHAEVGLLGARHRQPPALLGGVMGVSLKRRPGRKIEEAIVAAIFR